MCLHLNYNSKFEIEKPQFYYKYYFEEGSYFISPYRDKKVKLTPNSRKVSSRLVSKITQSELDQKKVDVGFHAFVKFKDAVDDAREEQNDKVAVIVKVRCDPKDFVADGRFMGPSVVMKAMTIVKVSKRLKPYKRI